MSRISLLRLRACYSATHDDEEAECVIAPPYTTAKFRSHSSNSSIETVLRVFARGFV